MVRRVVGRSRRTRFTESFHRQRTQFVGERRLVRVRRLVATEGGEPLDVAERDFLPAMLVRPRCDQLLQFLGECAPSELAARGHNEGIQSQRLILFRQFRQKHRDRVPVVQRQQMFREVVVAAISPRSRNARIRWYGVGHLAMIARANRMQSRAGFFEPLLGRFGQLRRHRTEQRNAVGRPGTRDDLEVMIAMPDDDRRPVIPAVERVAGIARIALEFLGGRLPVVDRHRRNDGRQIERDVPPGLLLAAEIGPLGSAQIILVGLADLDRMPRRRGRLARITVARNCRRPRTATNGVKPAPDARGNPPSPPPPRPGPRVVDPLLSANPATIRAACSDVPARRPAASPAVSRPTIRSTRPARRRERPVSRRPTVSRASVSAPGCRPGRAGRRG